MARTALALGAILAGFALACGSGDGGPTVPQDSGPVPIEGRFGDLEFQALLLQPSWDRLVGRATLINPTATTIAEGRYHVTLYLRPEGSEVVEIAVGKPRLRRLVGEAP